MCFDKLWHTAPAAARLSRYALYRAGVLAEKPLMALVRGWFLSNHQRPPELDYCAPFADEFEVPPELLAMLVDAAHKAMIPPTASAAEDLVGELARSMTTTTTTTAAPTALRSSSSTHVPRTVHFAVTSLIARLLAVGRAPESVTVAVAGSINKLLAGSGVVSDSGRAAARALGAVWTDSPAVRSFVTTAAQHGITAVAAIALYVLLVERRQRSQLPAASPKAQPDAAADNLAIHLPVSVIEVNPAAADDANDAVNAKGAKNKATGESTIQVPIALFEIPPVATEISEKKDEAENARAIELKIETLVGVVEIEPVAAELMIESKDAKKTKMNGLFDGKPDAALETEPVAAEVTTDEHYVEAAYIDVESKGTEVVAAASNKLSLQMLASVVEIEPTAAETFYEAKDADEAAAAAVTGASAVKNAIAQPALIEQQWAGVHISDDNGMTFAKLLQPPTSTAAAAAVIKPLAPTLERHKPTAKTSPGATFAPPTAASFAFSAAALPQLPTLPHTVATLTTPTLARSTNFAYAANLIPTSTPTSTTTTAAPAHAAAVTFTTSSTEPAAIVTSPKPTEGDDKLENLSKKKKSQQQQDAPAFDQERAVEVPKPQAHPATPAAAAMALTKNPAAAALSAKTDATSGLIDGEPFATSLGVPLASAHQATSPTMPKFAATSPASKPSTSSAAPLEPIISSLFAASPTPAITAAKQRDRDDGAEAARALGPDEHAPEQHKKNSGLEQRSISTEDHDAQTSADDETTTKTAPATALSGTVSLLSQSLSSGEAMSTSATACTSSENSAKCYDHADDSSSSSLSDAQSLASSGARNDALAAATPSPRRDQSPSPSVVSTSASKTLSPHSVKASKCATPRSKATLQIPKGVSPSLYNRRNRAKHYRETVLPGKGRKKADEKSKENDVEVEDSSHGENPLGEEKQDDEDRGGDDEAETD